MNSFSLFQLFSLAIVTAILLANCQADLCPDQKKSCRKGQTCCDDKQGGYGCCPYENATCCSDGLHCCPEETTCDLPAGRCHRTSRTIKQVKLVPISTFNTLDSSFKTAEAAVTGFNSTFSKSEDTDCPDHRSRCPDTYTCCMDTEGSFACCPFPDATCCSDKVHCCPHGKSCSRGRCV